MQIHELSTFSGTPTSTDYLAIDNSTTTTKIGATGLGIQDQMTVSEATTGMSTASRVITPKVLHDYVDSVIPSRPTVETDTDTWNGCDVIYTKYGRVVTIKVSGNTTSQITSTNGGTLTIRTIPEKYRPLSVFFDRRFITNVIEAQVSASGSALALGYTQYISGSNSTATNIPASSSIRIEICYISAS